ncbi:hypothetical protein [Amycolatopsis cihanbeyliensis]|uniref:Uncharacterized protein n=1 Tax=Amycolatopsis cihanbeyliensis TaxID=1128664 RepID=A0A542DH75_AMYCI|nr:hypothetical protein [Amycolatopsis cihanbeyliensis]TQJ02449.1 hypothetical protein FB471_2178 [Amycolatopsis cihanbeyliensis]
MADGPEHTWESFPDSESRLLKAYEVVAAHYRQDVLLYWTRLSVFLVVQAGLLAVFKGLVRSHSGTATVFALVGAAISVVWFLVARASVRWIEVWRRKVVELDTLVNPLASYRLESAPPGRRWWTRLTERPSEIAQALPLIFLLGWLVLPWV